MFFQFCRQRDEIFRGKSFSSRERIIRDGADYFVSLFARNSERLHQIVRERFSSAGKSASHRRSVSLFVRARVFVTVHRDFYHGGIHVRRRIKFLSVDEQKLLGVAHEVYPRGYRAVIFRAGLCGQPVGDFGFDRDRYALHLFRFLDEFHQYRSGYIIRNIRDDGKFTAADFLYFFGFGFHNVLENYLDVIEPRKRFRENGLEIRVYLEPYHSLRLFRDCRGERSPAATYLHDRVVFGYARFRDDIVQQNGVGQKILPEPLIEPETVFV